jgi:type II secretory pathway pseudopilin PulG
MHFASQTTRSFELSDEAALRLDGPDGNILHPAGPASRACDGHSLIELVIVFALIGIVTSMALPQLLAQRRLTRSVGVMREILTELRLTRQLAMSQRQAFTFQYDNLNKQISIIDHNDNPGAATLVNGSYPTTAKTKVVSVTPLAEPSIKSEMTYGIPNLLPAMPAGPLGDGISMTALINNQVNITFQPDGSVIKENGDPAQNAIFLYNSNAPRATASAISIMGASGRVKIWRYDQGANRYAD